MKLLKIIFIIFGVYFIRRFIQMYLVMKRIQEEQLKTQAQAPREAAKPAQGHTIVNAEFKVIK